MNIPKLRFPEFNGEWERKKLGEMAESIDSGWSPQCEEFSASINEWGVLKTTAIVWEGFNENENKQLPKKLKPKINCEVKPNDILITRAGPTTRVGVAVHVDNVRPNLILSDKIIRIRASVNYSSKFITITLSNDFAQKQILSKSSGLAVSQTNISQKILLNVLVFSPTLREQKLIASFFTVVDKKIAELKHKKSLLEQYKKGVMQKLSSQELRFKDNIGKKFADWEVKKLEEVLIKNTVKNKGQKYCLVQSVSNKHGFINQDEMFEDRRVASKDTSNYYVIQKGHFAYNPSRIDVGSLAYKFDNEISTISPLYISFRAKFEYLTDEYLLNWFSTEQFLMQMYNSFEGSVRNTLSYDSLKRMEISIPSLPEQTKIANFLSLIDEKINYTETQIQKSQEYRKGLLQQMFI